MADFMISQRTAAREDTRPPIEKFAPCIIWAPQGRRKEESKRERDVEMAVELLALLLNRKDQEVLKEVFRRFPLAWRKTVFHVLEATNQRECKDSLAGLIS